ncbi:4'-phosphopantetheinyl transferase superfamily protein [Myroides albus]|uniref:4'-phosphopantetheinyl transferase superfamily protein n=1 Tax=Myroides albus TaxID=2562892 RepID=A0A6I3LIQ9_9FLAO|nr:4'-phosphopantetheinyl transferase superfamily protein [Myroides albus]MTG98458.1 4'-phosphopantetheinyl transferase superfamily protein [Myroides albus]UVD78215.1 4'-phosphopantetheinyl transferase superfamily protein [Myroides albus]
MPLIQVIEHSADVKAYVWKVEESIEELLAGLRLRVETQKRLQGMKSQVHQKGFLAIRQLLNGIGYSDFDLLYDGNGKPYLIDGKFISISHSFEYATIIVGNVSVGIDVEKIREKIFRIAEKFCNDEELLFVGKSEHPINVLTKIWCAKEAMFKMCDSKGISFKDHMHVTFDGKASVKGDSINKDFCYYTVNLSGFTLVYAIEQLK